jgi:hypothetical protein
MIAPEISLMRSAENNRTVDQRNFRKPAKSKLVETVGGEICASLSRS